MPWGAAGQWDPSSVPCRGLYQLQTEWAGDGARAATAVAASPSTVPAGSWLLCSVPALLCQRVCVCPSAALCVVCPCAPAPSSRVPGLSRQQLHQCPLPGLAWGWMLGMAGGGGGGSSSRLISSRCGCWEPSSAPPPCRGPRRLLVGGCWSGWSRQSSRLPGSCIAAGLFTAFLGCAAPRQLFSRLSPVCTDPGAATQPQLLAAMGQVVLRSPAAPALLGTLGTLGQVLQVLPFPCSDAFGSSVRPPASPGCAFPLCPSIPASPSCQPMRPSPCPPRGHHRESCRGAEGAWGGHGAPACAEARLLRGRGQMMALKALCLKQSPGPGLRCGSCSSACCSLIYLGRLHAHACSRAHALFCSGAPCRVPGTLDCGCVCGRPDDSNRSLVMLEDTQSSWSLLQATVAGSVLPGLSGPAEEVRMRRR